MNFKKISESFLNGYRRLHKFNEEHYRGRKLFVTGSLLAIMILMVLGTRIGNRTSGEANTPLNEAQTFGGDNQYSLKLKSKAYNPDNDLMVLNFQASNDLTSGGNSFNVSDLKFGLKTLGKNRSTYQVVPLQNNHIVVLINDLKPGFRGVQIAVGSKTADTTSRLDKDSSSESTSQNELTAYFVVNEEKSLTNKKLKSRSQKDYAISDLNLSISKLETKISDNKKKILATKKQIGNTKETINSLKRDKKYHADQESIEDKISSAEGDKESFKQDIEDIRKQNKYYEKQKSLYKKQIADIETGKYVFDRPIEARQN